MKTSLLFIISFALMTASLCNGDETAPPSEALKILAQANEQSKNVHSFSAELAQETKSGFSTATRIFYRFEPDGVVLQRVEVSSSPTTKTPRIQPTDTVIVCNREGNWMLQTKKNRALNLKFQTDSVKSATAAAQSLLPDDESKSKGRTYELSETDFTGRPCYVVTETLSDDAQEAMSKSFVAAVAASNQQVPATAELALMIPAKNLYYIGKDNYFIYGKESYNKEGTKIKSMAYDNVQINIPLSDSLFEIPSTFKVVVVNKADDLASQILQK